MRACFSRPESLNAAFGYYRAFSPSGMGFMSKPINVPTVVFAGEQDGVATREDFEHAASMFTAGYVIESMQGGHFLHREFPDVFRERLLAHL